MDILVSIVIPVFKVEKYLDRCLESVVNQTYKNIEIILVDDGSPDNCPKMCDGWAERDNRIKVIHKDNAGLGMARNTGIDNASGDYIIFVDSDDYIDLFTVEKCVEKAIKTEAEMVVYGFICLDKNGKEFDRITPITTKDVFVDEEIKDTILLSIITGNVKASTEKNFVRSLCAEMISLKLIRNYGWKSASEREIISEDIYSFIELLTYVKKVAVINESFYYYCENAMSLSHTFRLDRIEKNKTFYLKCLELATVLGYNEIIKNALSVPYIINILASFKQIVLSKISKKEKYSILKNTLNDQTFQLAMSKIDLSKENFVKRILYKTFINKNHKAVYFLIRLKSILHR